MQLVAGVEPIEVDDDTVVHERVDGEPHRADGAQARVGDDDDVRGRAHVGECDGVAVVRERRAHTARALDEQHVDVVGPEARPRGPRW